MAKQLSRKKIIRLLNDHREALGRDRLSFIGRDTSALQKLLRAVEARAQYGEDYWDGHGPVVQDVRKPEGDRDMKNTKHTPTKRKTARRRKPISDAAYERLMTRQIADIDRDLKKTSNWK